VWASDSQNTLDIINPAAAHAPAPARQVEAGHPDVTDPTDRVASSSTGNTKGSPTSPATPAQGSSTSAAAHNGLISTIATASGSVHPQDNGLTAQMIPSATLDHSTLTPQDVEMTPGEK